LTIVVVKGPLAISATIVRRWPALHASRVDPLIALRSE
jgi:hypothetical protein